MSRLADRAAEIARKARTANADRGIAREWWTVTKPGYEAIDVFFCPPQTQAGVRLKFYPDASGVVSIET